MSEVIGAFLRTECGHKPADPAREARNGWFGSFPEMCLEFAEGLLDRVEVRGIFGKITELGAGCFNDLAYCGNPVDRKAVHHHNVAALFLRNGYWRYWLEDEAEGLGAAMQVVDDPRPITGLVGGRARVDVVHPMTQGVIEENCDLARGRGDRLDLPDARGKPPVKGTQGGVGSSDAPRTGSPSGACATRVPCHRRSCCSAPGKARR